MRTKVVILMGRSLFAEGVLNRLQQHLDQLELQVVDARQSDVIAQIVAAKPSAIIYDALDAETSKYCSFERLLKILPALKVILLDSQTAHIQVIQWEPHCAKNVIDLLDVIETNVVLPISAAATF